MKRFFVCFAMFIVMIFMVACGGSDNSCVELNGKTWSAKSKDEMSWSQAKDYCSTLNECEHSDWRLPTISELRSLIKNCHDNETNGPCQVSDSCLSVERDKNCLENCNGNCAFYEENSALGDDESLWSSSVLPEEPDAAWAWYVNFHNGEIGNIEGNSSGFIYNVRCVR